MRNGGGSGRRSVCFQETNQTPPPSFTPDPHKKTQQNPNPLQGFFYPSSTVLSKHNRVASFHNDVGFVSLTNQLPVIPTFNPSGVSVFSDVLCMCWLSTCAVCSLPLSLLEESWEVERATYFNQSSYTKHFPNGFQVLTFLKLVQGVGKETPCGAAWFCVALISVHTHTARQSPSSFHYK